MVSEGGRTGELFKPVDFFRSQGFAGRRAGRFMLSEAPFETASSMSVG